MFSVSEEELEWEKKKKGYQTLEKRNPGKKYSDYLKEYNAEVKLLRKKSLSKARAVINGLKVKRRKKI